MSILKANICILEHSSIPIFDDIANLLHHALLDSDCQSRISLRPSSDQVEDCILHDHINILLAPHLLSPQSLNKLPPETTILINTEPLRSYQNSKQSFHQIWFNSVFQAASRFHLWDYSQDNLQLLSEQGITHGQYLQLGYHEKLQHINHAAEKDIDVLFYGLLTPRRARIIELLQRSRLKVVVISSFFGRELDTWIARSRIVLNMHTFDDSAFEIVRCFYLMSNAVAIVSEEHPNHPIDPKYRDGVIAAPYEKLAETCVQLCRQPEKIAAQQQRALQTIQRYPQNQIIQKLLYDTFCR